MKRTLSIDIYRYRSWTIVRPVTHQEIQIQEQDLLKVLLFQYPELRENIDEAASLPILEEWICHFGQIFHLTVGISALPDRIYMDISHHIMSGHVISDHYVNIHKSYIILILICHYYFINHMSISSKDPSTKKDTASSLASKYVTGPRRSKVQVCWPEPAPVWLNFIGQIKHTLDCPKGSMETVFEDDDIWWFKYIIIYIFI